MSYLLADPNKADTIVAQATPKGCGGVGVVRISGPNTKAIAKKILNRVPGIRKAEYTAFFDHKQEVVDEGIALFFEGPHSFTGEDVLELQGHGGPVIMDMLIKAAVYAGARLAEPGEFSLRAYLNNKIDLCQAEAIAGLISATSEVAAKNAVKSLQGEFSKTIEALVERIIQLRLYVEAAIDFPEEEIDFLEDKKIYDGLLGLLETLKTIQQKAEQGVLITEGLRVAIIGLPNAGKSSLLNALSGVERAIVTDIPGTTRDVLREHINLAGLSVQLIDTAGLRESADVVEKEGINRALKEVDLADHLICVIDATEITDHTNDPKIHLKNWFSVFPKGVGVTVLMNKIDQTQTPKAIEKKQDYTIVYASVKTGAGLDLLVEHLKAVVGFSNEQEGQFMARRRHLEALLSAKQHLLAGEAQLKNFKAGELLAEELRLAQLALDKITGRFSSDDLLGKIFSEFCIGK